MEHHSRKRGSSKAKRKGEAREENQSAWGGSLPNLHDSSFAVSCGWDELWAIALQNSLREEEGKDLSAPYCHLLLPVGLLEARSYVHLAQHFTWIWKSGKNPNSGLGLGPGAVAAAASSGWNRGRHSPALTQSEVWWQSSHVTLNTFFSLNLFWLQSPYLKLGVVHVSLSSKSYELSLKSYDVGRGVPSLGSLLSSGSFCKLKKLIQAEKILGGAMQTGAYRRKDRRR